MTKLNSNGGDDKVDELLKERYDLAKDRIVEICTETTVKPDFLDFFQNMAAFLEKTAVSSELYTLLRESCIRRRKTR